MKKKQMMIIILVVAVVCCILSAVIAMTTKTTTSTPASAPACTVAKTDWINSKMIEDDWSQAQGEAVQKCKVPDNLQARIT